MKKLLTLASVALAAYAVNAAAFTWGLTSDSIKDASDEYIDGGTAFLYLGAATSSGTTLNIKDLPLLAYAGQNADYGYGNTDTSALSSSDALASTVAGQAYTLILVDKSGLTSADGYEGNYIAVTGSSVQDAIPGAGDTTYYASFVNGTAFTASDWTSGTIGAGGDTPTPGPIPEPTSGLLMLLGMAGLALKRKRA